MEKTGSSSITPWHNVQPFDSAETAYLKASQSAQRFLLLQFAVCPFSVTDSNNFVAHPAQESAAKIRLGTGSPSLAAMKSSSSPTVADTVFVERIRSRIKHWRNTCKKSGTTTSKEEEIINSIRNIVTSDTVNKGNVDGLDASFLFMNLEIDDWLWSLKTSLMYFIHAQTISKNHHSALRASHDIFSGEFDVRFVDKSFLATR
ncbi:hypothetical protein TSUD_389880, partial [Trifolium subterraneum]